MSLPQLCVLDAAVSVPWLVSYEFLVHEVVVFGRVYNLYLTDFKVTNLD